MANENVVRKIRTKRFDMEEMIQILQKLTPQAQDMLFNMAKGMEVLIENLPELRVV